MSVNVQDLYDVIGTSFHISGSGTKSPEPTYPSMTGGLLIMIMGLILLAAALLGCVLAMFIFSYD